jgi:plasmid stabilization system protein ParE
MNAVLTRIAQRDLAEIYDFVAAESPARAERLVARLVDVIRQVANGELKGPEVRLGDGRRVRRWSAPPYRIYYRRSPRRTVIVRIYHQARRPLEQR